MEVSNIEKKAALAAEIADKIVEESQGREYTVLLLAANLIYNGRIKMEITN